MNIPLYVAAAILCALFLIAYFLDLPEGWPRFAAVALITAVGVAMVVVSVQSQRRR